MAKKYVMFALDDDKTESLGEILGNKTSKKILDLLSEKEMCESDIAEKLKIPASTVGYNVDKLLKVGLIKEKKHLFSKKGKRVPYYGVSNKDIIISPKDFSRSKLKESISLISVSAIFTAFIIWNNKFRSNVQEAMFVAKEEAPILAQRVGDSTIAEGAGSVSGILSSLTGFGIVNWFLVGVWAAVLGFVIYSYIKEKSVRR